MSCYYCGKKTITKSQYFPCESCEKMINVEKKIRKQYFKNIIEPQKNLEIYIRGLVLFKLINTI